MQFFTDYIYTIPSFTIPSVGIAIEKKKSIFYITERGTKYIYRRWFSYIYKN